MNPLGFSPALLRGGDGRLGRSLDPILLYSQSYHSWTIVSVTVVTFTARSVHSRAADPDTLHFQGSPRLEQGQWRSASCQLWLARLPLPRLQIQSQRGLASLRRHSCLAGACGAMLSCGSLRLSFLSVRLPWWRWVQPSRVSSLTAPRSSFDCLASSTGAGTRESAHSQSNWCALNVCCRRVFCWVSSPMWPRPAYATASAILLSR